MLVKCLICKTPHDIDVTEEQVAAWKNGTLIQSAMPDVPAPLRELLISGVCPVCWDKMFAEPDEGEGE